LKKLKKTAPQGKPAYIRRFAPQCGGDHAKNAFFAIESENFRKSFKLDARTIFLPISKNSLQKSRENLQKNISRRYFSLFLENRRVPSVS
jgi:hypothetical protein